MSFPASTNTAASALTALRQSAARLKTYANNAKILITSNSVSANQILEIMVQFQTALQEWNEVAATPGLADYAKIQFNNANLDIVTEYNNMVSAAQNVISWVQENFPKDSNNYLLKDKFDSTSGLTVRIFTTSQTINLVSVLADFIAAVN